MSDAPPLAAVHTLYESNCRSIPDMLRESAKNIEAETDDPTIAMVAVAIDESGFIHIYGWGDTDDLRALGLLERGKHELLGIIADQTQ